ncbi:MAG: OmpA family protein [Candidatus Amulumruptor caecigallinarius]|nr:OmpA family protein [Candidatus Amulumruptor caecigallinarius]MCM1397690.1 OmpA family protein [Candidatus Amulumruptor caecigallinarius]MCM1454681.1 OmpA family protein [bacterium]
MKKSFLVGAMAALLAGQSAFAQEQTKEVTYVEDASQGLLMNRMKDNWFITGEVGANKVFSGFNNHRNFWNGCAPAFSIWGGKWFTPIIGVRFGVNMLMTKQLSNLSYPTYGGNNSMHNGYYQAKFNEIGPVADVMFNLHNWIGGYKPDRKWNVIVYAGGGGYWSLSRHYEPLANGGFKDEGWENNHDRVLTIHGGIINTLRLSKQVDLSLDFRYSFYDAHSFSYKYTEESAPVNRTTGNLQAYLGVTYKFKKRDWNGPMVPVCPPAEDCSQYIAALDDANAKISELETQLKACLDRPAPQPVAAPVQDHLATIYYPINVSRLTPQDKQVVAAIAQVMNNHPDTRYVVTGWADNYTGNDQINTRLRHARANGVKDALIANGVNPSQFDVTINAGNLCDLGEKCVSLDRAVTIDEVQ